MKVPSQISEPSTSTGTRGRPPWCGGLWPARILREAGGTSDAQESRRVIMIDAGPEMDSQQRFLLLYNAD